MQQSKQLLRGVSHQFQVQIIFKLK